ncbi:Potassium voltage-gated channel subfamily KQT member 1 [Trichinella pseudospiralis]|uniref:Potassium voltage-gated channel subfamily KQT member 1 n=1 Tax=Trichinella pseudospiralis TaxID=6337 RepID=A0A0V1FSZ7_TRIPS|nr:Potassium voltage-gated channel subfamily KQT member 1 [Trichinella pseudospiralis]KRY89070.1 Potassium voltage-gated channel subfamily KQT member 1 [Trichinella pseudospiralis]
MLNNKLRVKDVRWILYQCFECPKHVTHIVVHLAVCVVVVASLVINLLIETAEAGVDDHLLKLCLFAIELTLAVYFLGEILLRLWVIGIDHRFRGWRGKLRYMSSLNSLVDLTILSTTLLLCHVLDPRNRHSSRQELQNLIFVHLLRFLHLDRSGYTWNLLKRLFLLHRVELIAAAFLSSLTLLCIATVLAWWQSANNRQQLLEDGNSSNFPSAFYLTVVMYTTIGYGDYTPEGWFGKVFTSVMCWLAVNLLGLVSSVLGVGLALLVQDKKLQKQRRQHLPIAATVLQTFWRAHLVNRRFDQLTVVRRELLPRLIRYDTDAAPLRSNASEWSLFHQWQHAVDRPSSAWKRSLSKLNLLIRNPADETDSSTATKQDESTTTTTTGDMKPVFYAASASTGGSSPDLSSSSSPTKPPNPKRTMAQYKIALTFLCYLRFSASKQSFKRSKQSADLVDVSVKMNESETIQLSRLVNLQQKLEMSLGTQAARPEMSVSQRLGRLQHTVLSLHKQTDAVKSSLQTIRDHLKNTTI